MLKEFHTIPKLLKMRKTVFGLMRLLSCQWFTILSLFYFFFQTFEWPVARQIEKDEVIDIQLYNYNRYLSNRLVGIFRMILQELVEVGNVKICDSLLDGNNVVMKVSICIIYIYQ
ncbi:hypothetical protein KUTeg_016217 [Tegillarca granosa]|uniref:Uncharacterized protein n=1 Tax=Tegillarca granosa TaxID=220873 RepID=A0ABQ9EP14_TEGGR|nr:hypothetical protein KUTeg_016217 [Tegillarca granosa]